MRLSVPFRVSASSWGTAPAPRRLAGCCLDGQQRRASACPRPGHARLIKCLAVSLRGCFASSSRTAGRPAPPSRSVDSRIARAASTARRLAPGGGSRRQWNRRLSDRPRRGLVRHPRPPDPQSRKLRPRGAMTERPAIAPVRRRPGRYRRLEPEAPKQRPRGSVVPQRRGDQKLIAVLSGPLNGQPSEHRPDAETLQVVRDRRRRPRPVSRVASDANDRVPVAVDRCQRIVVDVVEVREVGELAGLETRLRGEKPAIARLGTEPGEQPGESVDVVSIDRPDLQSPTVSETEPPVGSPVIHDGDIRCLMTMRHIEQDTATR